MFMDSLLKKRDQPQVLFLFWIVDVFNNIEH